METKVTQRPPHSKKGGKKAPHDEKLSPPPTPHKEKNILKSYYMEKKQQKGPPIIIFLCFWEAIAHTLAFPPLRMPMPPNNEKCGKEPHSRKGKNLQKGDHMVKNCKKVHYIAKKNF